MVLRSKCMRVFPQRGKNLSEFKLKCGPNAHHQSQDRNGFGSAVDSPCSTCGVRCCGWPQGGDILYIYTFRCLRFPYLLFSFLTKLTHTTAHLVHTPEGKGTFFFFTMRMAVEGRDARRHARHDCCPYGAACAPCRFCVGRCFFVWFGFCSLCRNVLCFTFVGDLSIEVSFDICLAISLNVLVFVSLKEGWRGAPFFYFLSRMHVFAEGLS